MSFALRAAFCAVLLLAGSAVAAQAAVTPVPVGPPLARFDKLKPGGPSLPALPAGGRHRHRRRRLGPASPLRRPGRPAPAAYRPATGTGRAPRRPTASSTAGSRSARSAPDPRAPHAEGWGVEGRGLRLPARQDRGLKDLPDNAAKDFEVASPQPSFNFETDMEFSKPCRWRRLRGQHCLHPSGGGPPAPYVFKVAGSGAAEPARRRQDRLLGGDRPTTTTRKSGEPLLAGQGQPGADQAESRRCPTGRV